jgi:hypothetical protein
LKFIDKMKAKAKEIKAELKEKVEEFKEEKKHK